MEDLKDVRELQRIFLGIECLSKNEKEILNVEELAVLTGLSAPAARKEMIANKIKRKRVGRRVYYDREEALDFYFGLALDLCKKIKPDFKKYMEAETDGFTSR